MKKSIWHASLVMLVAVALCGFATRSWASGNYTNAVKALHPDHYYPLDETDPGAAVDVGSGPTIDGAYDGEDRKSVV